MNAMTSTVNFPVSPYLVLNSEFRPRCTVQVRSSVNGKSTVSSSPESAVSNGAPPVKEREKIGPVTGGNGYAVSKIEVVERKKVVEKEEKSFTFLESLEVLWDDAYGTKSMKDYLDCSIDMIRPDGGPPRWFCPVECGQPLNNSPVLLFLPGLDGTGWGLILHHKALGRAFEVRCLHIPVYDRTPFEDLVELVEKTVKAEYASSPNKPIYLVGDSFGGCLALAVAALNPTIDLVVLSANPATSFGCSPMQRLLPLLEVMPDGMYFMVPYFLSFVVGDQVKMATVNINNILPPRAALKQLSVNFTSLLSRLSGLTDILPKDTLLWKLKLLKSAASYTNSRLHAVNAEVLLLISGKDNMLPSRDEAQRLMNSLKNCRVRYFKDNGHALLLEDGINLLTIIKGTNMYRRRRTTTHNYILDFLPPSMSEYKIQFHQVVGLFRYASSAVLFSTLDDGKIVRGLAGVPSEGPVLLVGYHMLMGLEMFSLVEEFLREKNILVRGLAHSELFSGKTENSSTEFSLIDWMKVMGAIPVTGHNLFKLFSTKSHVLLYPGGARESFHFKGEQYKLFWPEQPEFVRMAARFGATIVPFGAVGEDDIIKLVLDHKDLMRIPFVNDNIRESSAIRVREGISGEVANEALSIPVMLPKVPGRLYYLFGKPIETRGRYESLKDKANAKELYLQVKSEVESCISYLLKKREEDPYRSMFDRTIHRVLHSPLHEIPSFEP